MGLTAAERKKLFKETLTGEGGDNDNSLISSSVQSGDKSKPSERVKDDKPKNPSQKGRTTKSKSTERIKDLEEFFLISKKIREVVDQEFGSDEKQMTYTTGMYPRYVSLLKRMSKSLGLSQGAILSAALCNMLSSFPEEEKHAIIKDEVNEIW
uniref:hypothetical protein n=1 Tax=Microscilla sp. PRE1 TaxID=155537 RepID=UPI00146F1C46|nr:hypothetical protein [Microscilla sp. PRE1]